MTRFRMRCVWKEGEDDYGGDMGARDTRKRVAQKVRAKRAKKSESERAEREGDSWEREMDGYIDR